MSTAEADLPLFRCKFRLARWLKIFRAKETAAGENNSTLVVRKGHGAFNIATDWY
jgi:hypothetical protein